MKRIFCLLALILAAGLSLRADEYTLSDTEVLSGTATAITIQQTASVNTNVKVVGVYVYCSVACTVTLERSGTAATTTLTAPVATSPGYAATTLTGYINSNVGAGTVVGQAGGYPVAAGSYLALRFLGADGSSSVNLRRGAADNFTVKVAAISGTAKLLIDYRQEAN